MRAMDPSLALIAVAYVVFKGRLQRQRIALLAERLRPYRIEKLMETLAEGYGRALGETDPDRQAQVWALMHGHEAALASQFRRFATDMARLAPGSTQVSTLPVALPHAERLWPSASFDLRDALELHARGIERAVANPDGLPPKARAFLLSAEMYLMQHTCHWYCKSKTVASARLLVRHKTEYGKTVAAVSPQTRQAYLALLGGG